MPCAGGFAAGCLCPSCNKIKQLPCTKDCCTFVAICPQANKGVRRFPTYTKLGLPVYYTLRNETLLYCLPLLSFLPSSFKKTSNFSSASKKLKTYPALTGRASFKTVLQSINKKCVLYNRSFMLYTKHLILYFYIYVDMYVRIYISLFKCRH